MSVDHSISSNCIKYHLKYITSFFLSKDMRNGPTFDDLKMEGSIMIDSSDITYLNP
jgi:hypothetical protein